MRGKHNYFGCTEQIHLGQFSHSKKKNVSNHINVNVNKFDYN